MADLKPRGGTEEAQGVVRKLFGNARTRGAAPWLDGLLVENFRIEPQVDTPVVHRLGRKPRGFLVVSTRLVNTTARPSLGADLSMRSCDQARATFWLATSNVPANAVPRIYSLWFW